MQYYNLTKNISKNIGKNNTKYYEILGEDYMINNKEEIDIYEMYGEDATNTKEEFCIKHQINDIFFDCS